MKVQYRNATERGWKRRDDFLDRKLYEKKQTSLLWREKHNRTVSARRKEQQSDSGGAKSVEIDDCARAGAELLAIKVPGVSK